MKKLFLVTISLLSIFQLSGSSCLPGGITFTTQAEIDNFATNYPGCTIISGDVHIAHSPDIVNLNGLNQLVKVKSLTIENNDLLIHIAGLNNLAEIENQLTIIENSTLQDFTFPNLIKIGTGILVAGNENLIQSGVLPQLQFIKWISYYSNNSLTEISTYNLTISGQQISNVTNINIVGNSQLQSINGFNGLSNSVPNIDISQNPLLLGIYGFNNLQSISELKIETNENLVEIAEFNLLQNIGTLEINQNPDFRYYSAFDGVLNISSRLQINFSGIQDFSGFSALTKVGDFHIYECDTLINFNGLNNLTEINGNADIGYNDNLVSLSGLNSLTKVNGYLSIGLNPILSEITALSSLSIVKGDLAISSLDGLLSFNGMNNLKTVEGSLLLGYLPLVSTFDGLSGLEKVGSLQINQNPQLLNLNGFDNLTTITTHGIYFDNNPLVSNFLGLNKLTSVTGNVSIIYSNNLQNFNGLQNLTALNGDVFIFGNSNLTSLEGLDNISYQSMTYIGINDCPNLNKCNVNSVCDYISNFKFHSFNNNAIGCSSTIQVLDACGTDNDGDGYYTGTGDCNDANPAINPNGLEICNGIDENCNNLIDDNCCQPPVITKCTANKTVDIIENTCQIKVNYLSPTYTGINAQVTFLPASGSWFAVGSHTVTAKVKNICGEALCNFTVNVRDKAKPKITCPANITISTDAAGCMVDPKTVDLGNPVVSDNCTVGSVINKPPTSYFLGNNTVAWTVLDASGNKATCNQTVKLEPTTCFVPAQVHAGGSNPMTISWKPQGCVTLFQTRWRSKPKFTSEPWSSFSSWTTTAGVHQQSGIRTTYYYFLPPNSYINYQIRSKCEQNFSTIVNGSAETYGGALQSEDIGTSENIRDDRFPSNELIAFPNPVVEYITIEFNNLKTRDIYFSLCGIGGNVILESIKRVENGVIQLVLNDFLITPGLYVLQIVDEDKIYYKRVMIEKG
ncbi:MAG: HYR domain-containing protein [Saprospiraceae bacterium]|nr:HYR domain-containing protein [Saprospiraceae bacterium]